LLQALVNKHKSQEAQMF